MTWITRNVGAYHGHFLDGYFRAVPHVHEALADVCVAARISESVVYGAIVRDCAGAQGRTYPALTREFHDDMKPGHAAFTIVARDDSTIAERLQALIRSTAFDIKAHDTYANYDAYQRDVTLFLQHMLAVYAAPVEAQRRIVEGAGLEMTALMTPRGNA